MPYIAKNNASSSLASNLTDVATSLTVQTGHGDRFPAVTSPDYTYVTLESAGGLREIVKVTARAAGADTMTIVRAQEGTTALAWTTGDIVDQRPTAGVMQDKIGLVDAHAATSKTTPVDADEIPLLDSAASFGLKRLTWANLKALLSTELLTPFAAVFTGKTSSTGSAVIPAGTTAQRDADASPVDGYLHYNTDTKAYDGRINGAWETLAKGGANTDITSLASLTSVNGGQLAGLRNKIINGNFDFWKRSVSRAAAATGSFTADRFQISYVTSAVVTVARSTSVPNAISNYSQTVTVTTADAAIAVGDVFEVRQKVEGFNIRDLVGNTFTLSFWVRSSKTGLHCLSFRNSGADRSYVAEYTIAVADTWEKKTVTVVGGLPTAGTWDYTNGIGLFVGFTLASGGTFKTATAGAWQVGDFRASTNAGLVNCLDTIGNVFGLSQVQLEIGGAATPFEQRPYVLEDILCSRYYNEMDGTVSAYAPGAANILYWTSSLPSPLRYSSPVPTVTVSPSGGGNYSSVTGSASNTSLVHTITSTAAGSVNYSFAAAISSEL